MNLRTHRMTHDNTVIPTYQTLVITCDQAIAHITLNRPQMANAINFIMWEEIKQAMEWIDNHSSIRVVILSGAGLNFCAGIDVNDLASIFSSEQSCEGRQREQLLYQLLKMQASFTAIEKCKKPVIAAIQKACVGAGLDLISACDIRLCSEDALFAIKEVDLGIVADMGVLQRLLPIINESALLELAYTGRNVDALEAKALGLVTHVLPTHELVLLEAHKMAAQIASKSPLTIRGIKKVVHYSRDHSVSDSLEYVATWNAGMLLSDDLMEALNAYQQKRAKAFKD